MPFFENAKDVQIWEGVDFEEVNPGEPRVNATTKVLPRQRRLVNYLEDERTRARKIRVDVEAAIVHSNRFLSYHYTSSPHHQPHHNHRGQSPNQDRESGKLDAYAQPAKLFRTLSYERALTPPSWPRREDVSVREQHGHERRRAIGMKKRKEKEVTLIDLSESVPDVDETEKREKEVTAGEEASSYLIDLAGLSFDPDPSSLEDG